MRITTIALVVLLSGCVSNPQPGTFKDDFDRQDAAKTRISLGLTYLKNGNYPQAKKNLDKALEFAPRSADVHYSLAYYYQRVGENNRADEAYNTAIDLAPRNADIANSYGAFLCQTGQYDNALDYFQKAINNQRYANSAETYENMALCAQGENEFEDAIGYLNEALNHQPGRPKSLYLLAEMYAENKQWNLAKQTLNRFERVGQVTPDYLWLAIRIAAGQGNYSSAEQYGEMLTSVYPTHQLVRTYRQAAQNWPRVSVTRKSKVAEVAVVESAPEKDTDPQPAAETATETNNVTGSVSQKEDSLDGLPPAEDTDVADTGNTEANAMADEPDTVVVSADPDQKPRFHVVKAQENLYRISLKYNIKMSTLQEWNNLDNNGAIIAGMKLWLVPPIDQEK